MLSIRAKDVQFAWRKCCGQTVSANSVGSGKNTRRPFSDHSTSVSSPGPSRSMARVRTNDATGLPGGSSDRRDAAARRGRPDRVRPRVCSGVDPPTVSGVSDRVRPGDPMIDGGGEPGPSSARRSETSASVGAPAAARPWARAGEFFLSDRRRPSIFV